MEGVALLSRCILQNDNKGILLVYSILSKHHPILFLLKTATSSILPELGCGLWEIELSAQPPMEVPSKASEGPTDCGCF